MTEQLVRDFYELAFDQHKPREAATGLRLSRRPKNKPPAARGCFNHDSELR